jgi:hypothetical protein
MSERWKPVPGYEELYEVSNQGRLARIKTRGGRPTWRILKATPGNMGYVRYALVGHNYMRRDLMAHRLAWAAFNGPIPDDLQINHKNGVKHDNRLDNLEIVTQSENTKHAFRVLKVAPNVNPNPGSRNGRAILTEDDIPKIRNLLQSGVSQTEAGRIFGVHQTVIGRIALGKIWRHVGQT